MVDVEKLKQILQKSNQHDWTHNHTNEKFFAQL